MKELIKLCRRKNPCIKKLKDGGEQMTGQSTMKQYIHSIAQDLKINANPKSFWSYVKSSRKGTNNLIALKVDDVTLTNDLIQK